MNTKTPTHHEELIAAAGRWYLCQFRRQRNGGYVVTSHMLLPLHIQADTLNQARANAIAAAEAWIGYIDCREFT